MNSIILLLIIAALIILFCYYRKIKKKLLHINIVKRLKDKANPNNKLIRKTYQSISDHLMMNPYEDIAINKWDKEEELIEKANIHRARLSKYGKSRMGGIVYIKGSRGGVYSINSKGTKKYV